jgi:beta-mannanase
MYCVTPKYIAIQEGKEKMEENTTGDITIIFDDFTTEGGYTYVYPEATSSIFPIKEAAHSGEVGLKISLDNNTYSGAAIGFAPIDFSKIKSHSAVEFWIKGENGGEKFIFSLLDTEEDNQKVATSVNSISFVKVTKEWKKVTIPLSKFGDFGKWWDGKQEQDGKFNWQRVCEVRFSIIPSPQPFVIYVDDIVFNKNLEKKEELLPEIEVITSDKTNDGCFIGVFGEGYQANINAIKDLEKKIGKKFAQIMWYCDWNTKFPLNECEKLYNAGYIPHITWEPWIWGKEGKINLDNIINGEWDKYIESWALSIKNFGKPLFLRVAHEFNGDWYPWSVPKNGMNPKKYITAWKHIHNIFTRIGVKNVQWIWCPGNDSIPNVPENDFIKAYPGDEYVDWIGIDGYNFGTAGGSGKWVSFDEIFSQIYIRIIKEIPNKPIMIGEFACGNMGGKKPAWIRNMGKVLKTKYPAIKSIVWFNVDKETDWRIDDEIETIKAAREVFIDKYFLVSAESLIKVPEKIKSKRNEYLKLLSLLDKSSKEKPVLKIPRRKNDIIIDGNLSDWEYYNSIKLDKREEFIEYGAEWGSEDDSIGNIKFCWDDKNLYIGAEITDDFPLVNPYKGNEIWRGDCLEIVIGTNPKADVQRKNFVDGDYQVGISSGAENIQPSIWIWTKNKPATDYEAVTQKINKGYILEVKFPWSNLNNFKPEIGLKYGFDFAIDDADENGEREMQQIWFGDDSFYKNPSVWGFAEFVK